MVFANVEPVQAAAPITGLVASAQRPTGDGRWVQGMSWVPERCGFTPDGWSPCETHQKAIGTPPGIVHYMPPGFSVSERCTTLSERDVAEAENRVRRQAEAATSFMVAQELWAGAITRRYPATVDDAPYDNPYLADGNATDVGGTHATARAALAALEAEALRVSHGQRVFLHVSPEWVPHLGDAVRRQGNLLLTNSDSVVVADGGYPGEGDITPGTSEVQTVDITGAPTGGTFTLTYDGQTTDPIPFDATATQVQTALTALPNVTAGDITATGGPLPGSTVTLTFGDWLGNVPQITGDGAALTGGTSPAVSTATTTEGTSATAEAGLWAYATGPVAVRLTDVEVLGDLASQIDRTSNRREVTGERVFAATFDPCIQLKVQTSALS